MSTVIEGKKTKQKDAGEHVDIAMVLPHLGPGGSQRVASTLLNEWDRLGKKCLLVTRFGWPEDAYEITSNVQRVVIYPSKEDRMKFKKGYHLFLKCMWGMLKKTAHLLRLASDKIIFKSRRKDLIDGDVDVDSAELGLIDNIKESYVVPVNKWLLGKARLQMVIIETSRLREIFNEYQPKTIVSFLSTTNIVTVNAACGMRSRVIISERNDPSRQVLESPWEKLRKKYYRRADLVTANTRGAIKAMEEYVSSEKLQFVPNPIKEMPGEKAQEAKEHVFLAVGRLVEQKGYDILIPAFARVASSLPEWKLEIVGDGCLRQELEDMCETLGVSDKVIFHGQQSDVKTFYQRSSIFVLPSRFEGMPNVLLEAMNCGLPAIVSDASPGPVELVESGAGLVVPVESIDAFANAMLNLAQAPDRAASMANIGRSVASEYALPRVIELWDTLLFSRVQNV